MAFMNIFDAARDGDFEMFKRLFTGDVNCINKYSSYNYLQLAVTEDSNRDGRLNIIRFLIDKGVDINYQDRKLKRNALHVLFFHFLKGDIVFLKEATQLLVQASIDINARDKFNSIPLKYAITISKSSTEDMAEIYSMLIRAGSDYLAKDAFSKSCIDYAREDTWRAGFLDLIGDAEEE